MSMMPEAEVFCSGCRSMNLRGSKYCSNCGMIITAAGFSATIMGHNADDVARVAGEVMDIEGGRGKGKIRILFFKKSTGLPVQTFSIRADIHHYIINPFTLRYLLEGIENETSGREQGFTESA